MITKVERIVSFVYVRAIFHIMLYICRLAWRLSHHTEIRITMVEVCILEERNSIRREIILLLSTGFWGEFSTVLWNGISESPITCGEVWAFNGRFRHFVERFINIFWSWKHVWILRVGRNYTMLEIITWNDNGIVFNLCFVPFCFICRRTANAEGTVWHESSCIIGRLIHSITP